MPTLCALLAACTEPAPVNKHVPVTKLSTGVYTIDKDHVQLAIAPMNERAQFESLLAAANNGEANHGEVFDGLWIVSLSHEHFEPFLIGEPGDGISPATAISTPSTALVIGSGFVSELHSLQPVGLLQKQGVTLNPILEHGYTRILGINDQGMGVVHRLDYQRNLFDSAIQAGPGIVERGSLDIAERDLARPKYFRSFVALCEDRWLAGVSLKPTNLRTVGTSLITYFENKALSCDEVVNLAGDREAFLAVDVDRTFGATITHEKTSSASLRRVLIHGEPLAHKVSMLGFRPISD